MQNPPPATDPTDILAAFAAHNAAAAQSLPPGAAPLGPKVARILELLRLLEPPDPAPGDPPLPPAPETARGEICELLKSLSWPVQTAHGPVETPLMLTLGKQDLCERLFRQDGAGSELDRRWISSAKIILYVACHDVRTFAYYYSSLPGQLLAVHEWYDQQITDLASRDLLAETAYALWNGHRITISVPAPAPHGTHTSGN